MWNISQKNKLKEWFGLKLTYTKASGSTETYKAFSIQFISCNHSNDLSRELSILVKNAETNEIPDHQIQQYSYL